MRHKLQKDIEKKEIKKQNYEEYLEVLSSVENIENLKAIYSPKKKISPFDAPLTFIPEIESVANPVPVANEELGSFV